MALRDVRITLRDRQTTGGSIPGDAQFGEPFVNLFDGVLRFSAVTGGGFEPSTQTNVFEVGSTLYNQKITNRLSINGNFIISGDTGLISTYQGTTGGGLVGKFLSGTSTGLVLADIADIATTTDSYTTGATWSPNLLTIKLNNGRPNVSVTIDTFTAATFGVITATGATNLNTLFATTISGGTLFSGSTNVGTLFVNTISNGTNTTVGGSANHRTINLVDSPSFNNITYSGTSTGGNSVASNVSATTAFFSAGTNLGTVIYSQITAITSNLTSTRVQPGTNITTGGTPDNPSVNLVASPSINNLSFSGTATGGNVFGTNVSGGTLFSGSTNVGTLFVNTISNGTNTTVGGSANHRTINLVDSPSVNGLTVSGTGNFTGTLQSGGTNVGTLFVNDVTAGTNISISGSANHPIINVIASPTFAGLVSATGFTDSSLTAGRVVYAGTGGRLTDEAGFTYDANSDTLNTQHIVIGTIGQTGTSATIYGDVLVIGQAISGFTSQLYIEDNNIFLNYNPTASTISTSLGAGWTIQDGSGVALTDAFMDIRGTATGVANRSFATNLNDLRIRETGTVSAPNGSRVLAENDVLDGGSY
jgi:hypothetical protein